MIGYEGPLDCQHYESNHRDLERYEAIDLSLLAARYGHAINLVHHEGN